MQCRAARHQVPSHLRVSRQVPHHTCRRHCKPNTCFGLILPLKCIVSTLERGNGTPLKISLTSAMQKTLENRGMSYTNVSAVVCRSELSTYCMMVASPLTSLFVDDARCTSRTMTPGRFKKELQTSLLLSKTAAKRWSVATLAPPELSKICKY